jgi:hypothetical protein
VQRLALSHLRIATLVAVIWGLCVDVIGHGALNKGPSRDSNAMHPAAYMLNLNNGQYRVMLGGQMPEWNFLGVKGNQLLLLSPVGGEHSAITHDFSAE